MDNRVKGSIYINESEVDQIIEQLKTEKQKIDVVFQKIKSDANGMVNYWTGNTGEEAYQRFQGYIKKFQSISDQIASYIMFLEQVRLAYQTIDQMIIKQMEENAKILVVAEG